MRLGDVLAKIANNARLTTEEMDFIRRTGNETQERNQFVSGNTRPDGMLNVPMPFFLAYSEKLSADKADVTIQIPSGFNNLMILTSCQTSDGSSRSLYAQANGDTGTNYNIQATSFTTSTTYVNDLVADHFIIGYANASASTNLSAAGVAYFNNYGSAWYKTCIATINAASLTTIATSSWENTTPINSLRIYAQAGNLVAGSIISVYCMV